MAAALQVNFSKDMFNTLSFNPNSAIFVTSNII